jgi:hypothetical protein
MESFDSTVFSTPAETLPYPFPRLGLRVEMKQFHELSLRNRKTLTQQWSTDSTLVPVQSFHTIPLSLKGAYPSLFKSSWSCLMMETSISDGVSLFHYRVTLLPAALGIRLEHPHLRCCVLPPLLNCSVPCHWKSAS